MPTIHQFSKDLPLDTHKRFTALVMSYLLRSPMAKPDDKLLANEVELVAIDAFMPTLHMKAILDEKASDIVHDDETAPLNVGYKEEIAYGFAQELIRRYDVR